MLLTVFQSFYNYCNRSVLVKIICMYKFKIDQSKFPNPCTQGMKERISDYVNKHDRCGMKRLETVRSKVKSRWSLALNTCVMNNDTTNGKTPCRTQNNCPQVHGLKHYRLLPYMLSKMHSNTQNHCFYAWLSSKKKIFPLYNSLINILQKKDFSRHATKTKWKKEWASSHTPRSNIAW